MLPQMRLLLVLLLAAAPALAAVPDKGEGTVTILGGVRAVYGNGAYLDEQFASHQLFQPAGLVSFGYQYDEDLHFKIESGYLLDSYKVPEGKLLVRTIPLLIAIDTALWKGNGFTLYGGGGVGYSLNTGTRKGTDNEANSTAAYLALGFRLRLNDTFALVFEDRVVLSSAQVDAGSSEQRLNVGGNLTLLGIMFHFNQPDDKGHPRGPKD